VAALAVSRFYLIGTRIDSPGRPVVSAQSWMRFGSAIRS